MSDATQDHDDVPRYLRIALANAERAFQRGELGALGTINETIQPLVDAAIGYHRRALATRDARVAELEREVAEARAEGRREMREAAARICDSSAKGWREDSGTPVVALGLTMAARTIRALPDTPTPTDPA